MLMDLHPPHIPLCIYDSLTIFLKRENGKLLTTHLLLVCLELMLQCYISWLECNEAPPFHPLSLLLILHLTCQSGRSFLEPKTDDVCFEYNKHFTSIWNDHDQWWNPDCYLLWSRTVNTEHVCQFDQLLLDPKNICINSYLPDTTDWLTCDFHMPNWMYWHFVKQHIQRS